MVHRQTLNVALGAVAAGLMAGLALGTDPESVELLKRVTAKVAANSTSIRNYTCVETVRRDHYQPQASTLPRACPVLLELRNHPTPDMLLRLMSMDRLRLEVTTTLGGEMYSPVGSSQFEDGGIHHVVRQGPIGNGMFNSFLSVVFGQDVQEFRFAGESTVSGRRLLKYSFVVPQPGSHYRVKLVEATGWTISAYSGDVLVDAETADPVQLTLRTGELPSATGACQVLGTLDFSRVQIGAKLLLLARQAAERFIARDGLETENTVTFSNCREYSSNSRLLPYGESESKPAGAPESLTRAPQRVRAGLRFVLELTAPVVSDEAAAGDRFTARLTQALRDGKQILAPKGALVEGYISMLDVKYHPAEEVFLGLTPETVEVDGRKLPLTALPDSRALMNANRKGKGQPREIYLPPREEYSAVFRLAGIHGILSRGFTSEWLTIDPQWWRR